VWFGSGGWGGSIWWGWGWLNKFSILSNKKEKRKKKYTLIIPVSDWTIIYFASMLANSVFSSNFALRINPCPQHPCLCVWSMYTRYFITFIFDYPYIPGLLILTFVVCRILASLSIVTGVAVSFNEVKPDSGIE
jgi:hypothetical protein